MKKKSNLYYKELVDACLNGDESSWQELVELVTPAILAVCRMMRLSREESLDIFGQVCCILLENLKNLKSPEKIIGFVSTSTRREILRVIRRKKLFDSVEDRISETLVPAANKTPEELYDETSEQEILIKAIMELPDKESKLMWYLFLDETCPSYEEISAKLDIPIASIGPTRIRSLEKLRRILKRNGYKL